MQILKMGLAAAVLVGAAIGLLWATEIVPADDLRELAAMAYGGLLVLMLASVTLRLLRRPAAPDGTDRPVP